MVALLPAARSVWLRVSITVALSGAACGCNLFIRSNDATFESSTSPSESGDAASSAGDATPVREAYGVCSRLGEPLVLKAALPRQRAWFGESLAAHEDVLVVTAPLEKANEEHPAGDPGPQARCENPRPEDEPMGGGAVRVYERGDAGWSEESIVFTGGPEARPLLPREVGQLNGQGNFPTYHVAAESGRIAIGSAGDDDYRGSVRLLERGGPGDWTVTERLDPMGPDDRAFGMAVALSGDTLVVGAPGSRALAGSAYIYDAGGPAEALLRADAPQQDGWFGAKIAVSPEWTVVAAAGENGPEEADRVPQWGAVYAFERRGSPGDAIPQKLEIPPHIGWGIGASLGLSETTLAVGVPGAYGCSDDATGWETGVVLLFTEDSGRWSLTDCLEVGQAGALFGWSLALTDEFLVVGMPWGRADETAENTADGSVDALVADGSGAVLLYERTKLGVRHEPCVIRAPNADVCDFFGLSVAASDDFIAVGAPLEDGHRGGIVAPDESNELVDSGAVYVYPFR